MPIYNKAKKHHYSPQSYLRGFAYQNCSKRKMRLYHYKKVENDEGISFKPNDENPVLIKDIAWKEDYYPYGLEEYFSSTVENAGPPLIKKIEKMLLNDIILDLTYEEKDILATYIALNFTRSPYFRDSIEMFNERITKAALIDYRHHIITNPSPHLDDKWISILGKSYHIDEYDKSLIDQETSLQPILDCTADQHKLLMNSKWYFFVAPLNSYFIICDNPLIREDVRGKLKFEISPRLPRFWGLTALTKNCALGFAFNKCREKDKIFRLINEEVKNFNLFIAYASYKEIFSSKNMNDVKFFK